MASESMMLISILSVTKCVGVVTLNRYVTYMVVVIVLTVVLQVTLVTSVTVLEIC